MVGRRNESGESLAGILFVIGTRDESALSELVDHARTALGGLPVEIVGWIEGDNEASLGNSVRELLRRAAN
jgi:hypothetical protein